MPTRIVTALVLVLMLLGCATWSQNSLVGDWSGTLNMGGGNLRLIFHISEAENGFSATVESVDQGGAIIPAAIVVNGDSITFVVEQIGVEYIATMSGNQIAGAFNQFGMTMPDFTISRTE